jgi:hypothetical protein
MATSSLILALLPKRSKVYFPLLAALPAGNAVGKKWEGLEFVKTALISYHEGV